MQLSPTLCRLVIAAADTAGVDRLLGESRRASGEDGVALAGLAAIKRLGLEVLHPLIAKRTWLWCAEIGS